MFFYLFKKDTNGSSRHTTATTIVAKQKFSFSLMLTQDSFNIYHNRKLSYLVYVYSLKWVFECYRYQFIKVYNRWEQKFITDDNKRN